MVKTYVLRVLGFLYHPYSQITILTSEGVTWHPGDIVSIRKETAPMEREAQCQLLLGNQVSILLASERACQLCDALNY